MIASPRKWKLFSALAVWEKARPYKRQQIDEDRKEGEANPVLWCPIWKEFLMIVFWKIICLAYLGAVQKTIRSLGTQTSKPKSHSYWICKKKQKISSAIHQKTIVRLKQNQRTRHLINKYLLGTSYAPIRGQLQEIQKQILSCGPGSRNPATKGIF